MPQADFHSGAPAVDFEKESTFLTGARLALNIVKVNFFFFYLCQKLFHYMYVCMRIRSNTHNANYF